MTTQKKVTLEQNYQKATQELATLNRELAAQMVLLASQTGDTEPLIAAVGALREADELYSQDATPRENAEIRQALADTLLTLGRANEDAVALEHAIAAYRDAITLASMLGDQKLRTELKRQYKQALELASQYNVRVPMRGAA